MAVEATGEVLCPSKTKVFTGNIPEVYDAYLVPLIFAPYAEDLARRIVEMSASYVLETAAGSAVVTRALAPLLSSAPCYVVTDLNQAMLDHARARQGDDQRITWQQADALDLPFSDRVFDAVCCQFGVMFFADKVIGFSEARRVLKANGRFVFSVWDKIEANEFAQAVTNALSEWFASDPPLFLARTPHGYHDLTSIERDLRAAGFDDVRIDTIDEKSSAPSARHPAIAYCQGTPLRNEIEARDASVLEHATEHAAQHIAKRFGAGAVCGRIRAHVITATA